jgi:hypothetical protein
MIVALSLGWRSTAAAADGAGASDPKAGIGFGKNPTLKQKEKSAGPIPLRRLLLWSGMRKSGYRFFVKIPL